MLKSLIESAGLVVAGTEVSVWFASRHWNPIVRWYQNRFRGGVSVSIVMMSGWNADRVAEELVVEINRRRIGYRAIILPNGGIEIEKW